MALSYANRHRGAPTVQQQQQATLGGIGGTLVPRQYVGIRKQYSFIETSMGTRRQPISSGNSSKYTAQQRGYLSRGLSVGRSIENIRQKLYTDQQRLRRQSSVDTTSSVKLTQLQSTKAAAAIAKNFPLSKHNVFDVKLSNRSLVAWSSQSSLVKNLDNEAAEANSTLAQKGSTVDVTKSSIRNETAGTNKTDTNRINLNIVLAPTIRATTEHETTAGHSDIESSIDCAEAVRTSNKATTTTAQRRAQFQQSGSNAVTANVPATATATPAQQPATATAACILPSNSNSGCTQLSISPSLTVQRRPPLVRAMSAPVRGLDENSKNAIAAATKRQQKTFRRRKILTRNISCDKAPVEGNILIATDADASCATGSNKKLLARSRTVATSDVITLVSLLSSEGSDSEKEDTTAATANNKNETKRSPNRRAPFLRKTGKSVSFQDNYPPTFQLASKEYSHMIRRGSIAPLAARIRSNRPPTAPPVSIFLSDKITDTAMEASAAAANKKPTATSPTSDASSSNSSNSEKENNAANCNKQEPEYNYPDYVCSIKERECWKLYQKMCAKGVTVAYDTILRGMLTPTEFRQLQKQRELQEAKAKEAAEAADNCDAETKPKAPITAIERLSDSLLNKK